MINEEPDMSPYARRQDTTEHLVREKRLFAYNCALENGDFEIVAAILNEAQADPDLERRVLEINAAHVEEMQQTAQDARDTVLTGLLRKHFHVMDNSAATDTTEDDIELPPLTVGDVLAHVRSGGELSLAAERNELAALQRRTEITEPIPQDLSGRGVRQFLARLGVTVSRRVENAFRNTAILLAQGRQQNMAQLAATRRQSSTAKSPASKVSALKRGDDASLEDASPIDPARAAAPPAPEQEPRP